MRWRMTLSSGLSLAQPFSFIHGCCRISSAVARLRGSCGPGSVGGRVAPCARWRGRHGAGGTECTPQPDAIAGRSRPGQGGGQGSACACAPTGACGARIPWPRWRSWARGRSQSPAGPARRTAGAGAVSGRPAGMPWSHVMLCRAMLRCATLALMMESKICCSVSPQKGGTPDSRMYKITPHDQMSASGPYLRRRTYGAR